jgi:HEAT repeat protein
MNSPETRGTEELIANLASEDPTRREQARLELMKRRSHDVVTSLVATLTDPREHVRWEAAKALAAMADPVTAPALLVSLDDENGDVRWVAGEGLIALGTTGLLTVLQALTTEARSLALCRGAHHVLRELSVGDYAVVLAPVLAALEKSQPAVAAPPAAYDALRKLSREDSWSAS